jgi:quercetin dioxygenase-like cupin family protein
MKVHGRVRDVPGAAGIYAGHSTGYLRRVLFGRDAGSPHQEAAVVELAPGGSVERHVHAYEEAFYVLEGRLEAEIGDEAETLAADDHVFVERGVSHSLHNAGDSPARWFELAAPQPGSATVEDTVFVDTPRRPDGLETAYRRGHFDPDALPEPSSAIGLAGFGQANVGGAALEIIVGPATGASQLTLMVVQYAPGGFIAPHDHAFEEGFFVLTGELEAQLEDATHVFGPEDYFWSGVGSLHALTNRGGEVVRWLETQVPQPPSRHQARFVAEWQRYLEGGG